MKMQGRELKGPNVEYVVIPRPDGDLIFKCQAVLSMEEFERLCPLPKPGNMILPGGQKKDDFTDPVYLAALSTYRERRYAYMIIKSLEPTNIEWETVKLQDVNTWLNWQTEMEQSGFTFNEIQLVQIGMASANGINQEKLDEARNRFLASLSPINAS